MILTSEEGRMPDENECNNGSQELALSQFPERQSHIWDESQNAVKNSIRLGRRLRWMRFDKVYLAYPSFKREGVVGLLARAREKTVLLNGKNGGRFLKRLYSPKRLQTSRIHNINANYALFEVANRGYLNTGSVFNRTVEKEYKDYADNFFSDNGLQDKFVIAVHPGANGNGKRWAPEKLIELCSELAGRFACRFVIVGGRDESGLKQTVIKGIGESAVMPESPTLFQTASIIKKCGLFIGNDSAPMHMSAILGVPVIALWSYTDFYKTSPYGADNLVIRKACDCSPCYNSLKRYINDCEYGMKCINGLSLENILPLVSGYIRFLLNKKRTMNSRDIDSLKVDGIERVYELEHGCTVVDFRG